MQNVAKCSSFYTERQVNNNTKMYVCSRSNTPANWSQLNRRGEKIKRIACCSLVVVFFSTSSSKRFSFTMQFRTLSISVASLYYYFTRCSVVELYCQLTQHSTKRNRTSCHWVLACAVFFRRTSLPHKTIELLLLSLCVSMYWAV